MAVIFTIDSLCLLLTISKSYIPNDDSIFLRPFLAACVLLVTRIMKGASYAFAIGPERQ